MSDISRQILELERELYAVSYVYSGLGLSQDYYDIPESVYLKSCYLSMQSDVTVGSTAVASFSVFDPQTSYAFRVCYEGAACTVAGVPGYAGGYYPLDITILPRYQLRVAMNCSVAGIGQYVTVVYGLRGALDGKH